MHYLDMALISKASLLMVPSTYEQEKLYNVLPSGNRAPDSTDQNSGYDQTRADFTFDRGSNAAATRVNSNGLIEKYRENLFTQSNNLGGITLDRLTKTTGHADPLGGNNAALLTENTSAGTHRFYIFNIPASDAVHTYSIYAKPNGRSRFQIVADGGGINAQWNISTGTLIGDSNEIKSNIEDVGDGWYRLSLTYYGAGWIGGYFFNDSGSNSYTGDGTSGVYVFGAQVELGLVATDYLDSGATTAKAGVLIDLPRINYDANGENGALLLEPSRLNVIPYSEYFSASDWTKSNVAVIDNATTSPEGVQNAALVYPSSSSSTKWGVKIEEAKSGLTNSVYTNSIYIKPNGWRWVYMIDPSGLKSVWFDLQEGVVGTEEANATGDIEPMSDGWYKCTIYPHTSPTTYIYSGVYFSDADNSYVCTASGTNGVYLYGAQSEAGSYSTSYIPNHGESGGVTRAADSECDILNLLSNGIISSATEWTIFFDVEGISDTFNTSDGQFFSGQGSTLDVYIRPGNTSQEYTRFYWRKDSKYIGSAFGRKICARLSGGTGTTFVDGTLNGSSSISGDYSSLGFARNPNLPGYVNKIIFFPTALTDAECITLTTL